MQPIYVVMTALFILGLICLGLGFTYEDCSFMHTISFDETPNCADSWVKEALVPFGLFILGITPTLPSIKAFLEDANKINVLKINE